MKNIFLAVVILSCGIIAGPHSSEAGGATKEVKNYSKEAVKIVRDDVDRLIHDPYRQSLREIKVLRKYCSKNHFTDCVSDMSDYNNYLRELNKMVATDVKQMRADLKVYLKQGDATTNGVDVIIIEYIDDINEIIDLMSDAYIEIVDYFS